MGNGSEFAAPLTTAMTDMVKQGLSSLEQLAGRPKERC